MKNTITLEFMLQMFALVEGTNANGTVISGSTGAATQGIDPPEGTRNPDLAPEMKTFYDKALIRLAGPALVHNQFGQKRPIPKGNGKTIEFRKFEDLPKALKPLSEGVTPTGNKLKVTSMTATVEQYGDYIEQTDMLEMTAIDNTIVEATKQLADQAGRTLDTITRNALNAGTNVIYSSKWSGTTPSEVTSRSALDSTSVLKADDILLAATALKRQNAKRINGDYVAIVHPDSVYEIMHDPDWKDWTKYTSPEHMYKGEIGKIGSVRFVESTEAKIFGPAVISDGFSRLKVAEIAESAATSVVVEGVLTAASGVSIPCYIDGVENTITAITPSTTTSTLTVSALSGALAVGDVVAGKGGTKDGLAVYSTLVLAEDAYGVTDVTGGGMEMIVKQKGYGNDPLNQRSSIGWKAVHTAEILVEQYMVRVESVSPKFSAITESN